MQEHTISWDSRPSPGLKNALLYPSREFGCFEPPVLNSLLLGPGSNLYSFLHPQPRVRRGALLGNRELTQSWLLHRLASKFGDIWKREPVGVADGLGIGADEKGRVKIDSKVWDLRSSEEGVAFGRDGGSWGRQGAMSEEARTPAFCLAVLKKPGRRWVPRRANPWRQQFAGVDPREGRLGRTGGCGRGAGSPRAPPGAERGARLLERREPARRHCSSDGPSAADARTVSRT